MSTAGVAATSPTTSAEPQQHGRTRTGTGVSAVNILPIPPVLDFPYPEQPDESAVGAGSSTRPSAPRQQSFPFFPPRKASTAPHALSPGWQDASRQASTLATPGLLSKVTSHPVRPMGPRQYGTERPSMLHRASTKGHESVYNPEAWGSDYSESSDNEAEKEPKNDPAQQQKGDPARAGPHTLQRTSTAPLQRRPSDQYRRFAFGDQGYQTRGHVSKRDGRLNISLRETGNKGYLAKALGASLEHHLAPGHHHRQANEHHDASKGRSSGASGQQKRPQLTAQPSAASTVSDLSVDDPLPIPKLNIVVMVIGSRGDIQPFLRLGKILKEEYGHRVRIATHPTFKQFVEEDAKLEFFSVGGDPAELMAFMVKNPGLIPKTETLTSGEIPRRRAQMFQMFQGFWRACINSSDSEPDPSNRKLLEAKHPFVADAIIANPPCFAHVHCAERLGIPLHLMFTFPNTPTQQFPHPLTNIRQTNVDVNYTNFMSYPLVEMMQWQGLGDLINDFRVKTLGLDPMSMLWAPGQLYRLKVPYSYLWSPGLIPKPPDWGSEINITGFVFLDLASTFKPPDKLTKFLEAGEPPVYIGFGSIVVDDPDKFTSLIFDAVKKAGVRALVNKGWGGLGSEDNVPEDIYMLDNTPHDWLFPRVRAVVHHGGAGTTAIGLKCGKPTMVVPFFGDQPFWGAMIAKAGAGAEPVPYKELSSDALAEGIKMLLTEEKQKHAKEMAASIEAEGDGAINAVKSFHKHLPRRGQPSFRCSILQERVAAWSLKGTDVKLSPLAAHLLVENKKLSWSDLRLARVFDWNDFEGPGEPLTGMGTSIFGSLIEAGAPVGKVPFHWGQIIRRKRQSASKRRPRDAKSKDKEPGKLDKDGEKKDAAKQDDHDKKVSATMPGGQHASSKRSDKGAGNAPENHGEHGVESKLPGGNEPAETQQQPSKFHMPYLRRKVQNSAQYDEHTLVDDSDESDGDDIAMELMTETGRGLKQSGGALVKMPMNLFLAIARGFHNAPRLYGDETVRTTRRITGFHSGLHAAADEFVYGVWDGWSGVVRHPYNGAKYDGAVGFIEGVGKGAGGFVLKDLAAVFGVPAYTMKGVHKELTKYRQPTAFIRRTREVEGQECWDAIDNQKRQSVRREVLDGWQVIESVNLEIQKVIKEEGVRGRVRVWRHRQWLRENGVLDNVKGLQRALEAKRAGRDWEVEFREEMERRQKEQARALKRRRSEKKKQHERDAKGRKTQSPDVRMKSHRGTQNALKKSAKRADKKWAKFQNSKSQEHAEAGAPAESPRRDSIATAHDGVATTDHSRTPERSEKSPDLRASSTTRHGQGDSKGTGDATGGMTRPRDDSGETLAVNESDASSALRSQNAKAPLETAAVDLSKVNDPAIGGQSALPRTVSA